MPSLAPNVTCTELALVINPAGGATMLTTGGVRSMVKWLVA